MISTFLDRGINKISFDERFKPVLILPNVLGIKLIEIYFDSNGLMNPLKFTPTINFTPRYKPSVASFAVFETKHWMDYAKFVEQNLWKIWSYMVRLNLPYHFEFFTDCLPLSSSLVHSWLICLFHMLLFMKSNARLIRPCFKWFFNWKLFYIKSKFPTDCNGTEWFVNELSGCRFQSHCNQLIFTYRACFEWGVPPDWCNHRV